ILSNTPLTALSTLSLHDALPIFTPDSSRFWPVDQYQPGRSQPSFDKQPLRDWLAAERAAGRWNGEAPAPSLPPDVIGATSARYIEAYQRLTGGALPAED